MAGRLTQNDVDFLAIMVDDRIADLERRTARVLGEALQRFRDKQSLADLFTGTIQSVDGPTTVTVALDIDGSLVSASALTSVVVNDRVAVLHIPPAAAYVLGRASGGGIPPSLLPVVSGVNPSMGSSAGGTTVTITGVRLTGATQVRFGAAPGAIQPGGTDTTLTVISPPSPGGSSTSTQVDVTVTTASGTSDPTVNDLFTYVTVTTSRLVDENGTFLITETGAFLAWQ